MKLLFNLRESAAAAPACAKIWVKGVRNGVAEWPAIIGDVAQLALVLVTPIAVAVGIVRAHRRNHRLGLAREKFLKDLHAGDPLAVAATKQWWTDGLIRPGSRFNEPAPSSPSSLN